MNYRKPSIEMQADALASIQKQDKGTVVFGDSIDPNSPNHYLTSAAYEADE